jgi:hypothetical protein
MNPRKKYNIDFIIDCKKRGLTGGQIARLMKNTITGGQVNWVWREHCKKYGLDTKTVNVAK